MKKHFFLFSFMLCFTLLASAQNAKMIKNQKRIQLNEEMMILSQSKADQTKKSQLASKSDQNPVKGADQLAAEAEQQKIKIKH